MKSKKILLTGCLLLFLAVYAVVMNIWKTFTREPQYREYVTWEHAAVVEDGKEREVAFNPDTVSYEPVADIRLPLVLSATLKADISDALLCFSAADCELTLSLDGEELYRGTLAEDDTYKYDELELSLPQEYVGKELKMTYRSLSGKNYMVPIIQLSSMRIDDTSAYAYGMTYGIQAGAYGVLVIGVFGLFFLGLFFQKRNFSLLLLGGAVFCIMILQLNQGMGYYFLSERLNQFLTAQIFTFLPSIFMLLYLIFNGNRHFMRKLGKMTAFTLAVLLAACAVSMFQEKKLARYVYETVVMFFTWKSSVVFMYWITLYLCVACFGISVYDLVSGISREQVERQTLLVKNELAKESFRMLEQNAKQTLSIRHEMKNQFVVLHLLYQKGETKKLGAYLKELDQMQAKLCQTVYTDNFLVNVILQNYFGRASEKDVAFEAVVHMPKTVPIADGDIISFFMNLLENAVDAAGASGAQKHYVKLKITQKDNFLAVYCENSYDGRVVEDKNGRIATRKANSFSHGYGIRQMEKIAQKYGSILDVSYTEDVFFVQTAFRMDGNCISQ